MVFRSIVKVSILSVCLLAVPACDRPEPKHAETTVSIPSADSEALAAQKKKFFDYVKNLPPLQAPRKGDSYELVVVYLEDPLLPTLTDSELKDLLLKTEDYAREYLDLKIKLRFREKADLAGFFKSRAKDLEHPVFSYPARAWHIDMADPAADAQIIAAIREAIHDRPEDLLEEYFGPIPEDREVYVKRIHSRFMEKLGAIYGEKDASGKPLFDARANPGRREQISFAHWDTLLYQEKDVDFYLTNTILAGPDTGMPLYVINRGGVTSAFIENNEHRPYQGVGMLGLYPMLSDGEFFTKTRGRWTAADKRDSVAFIWLHELGHLLLRKSENYTLNGSIHRAPVDLDYRSWMRAAKAGHKKIDHSKISLLKKF